MEKKTKPILPNSIKNTPNMVGGCTFIKQVLNYIFHFTKGLYLWFGNWGPRGDESNSYSNTTKIKDKLNSLVTCLALCNVLISTQ